MNLHAKTVDLIDSEQLSCQSLKFGPKRIPFVSKVTSGWQFSNVHDLVETLYFSWVDYLVITSYEFGEWFWYMRCRSPTPQSI